MKHKDTECKGAEWIHLVHNKDQWWVLINVNKLSDSIRSGEFLNQMNKYFLLKKHTVLQRYLHSSSTLVNSHYRALNLESLHSLCCEHTVRYSTALYRPIINAFMSTYGMIPMLNNVSVTLQWKLIQYLTSSGTRSPTEIPFTWISTRR